MNAPSWESVIAAIGSVIASIVSAYSAIKLQTIHVLLNSRLSRLLKLTEEDSFRKGEKAEQDKHADKK
jgi:hypothetical protein